jgi:hypothetical protein
VPDPRWINALMRRGQAFLFEVGCLDGKVFVAPAASLNSDLFLKSVKNNVWRDYRGDWRDYYGASRKLKFTSEIFIGSLRNLFSNLIKIT